MLVSALRPAAALAWTSTCSSAWRAFSDYSKGNHSHDSTETIDFGFQQVPREQKQELVGQVFSSVAQSYDLMNDLMSGGIHRLWKGRLVESLDPAPHLQHIDVAGGTGDVAFRVVRAMRAAAAAASSSPPAPQQHLQQWPGFHQQPPPPQQHTQQQGELPSTSSQQEKQQQKIRQQQPSSSQAASSDPRESGGWVTVCDINPDMLAVGQQRAAQQGLDARMSFVEGNAEALPFSDASFDAYTIAFGIRNVTDRPAALRDAWRVLRRGGRFMCLEFSQVQVPLLREVYDAYSLHVIPAIGGLVARDAASYQYLVESIRQFPDQDTFAGMLRDAGFKAVSYENLTGGIVAMHSGFKL